MNSDTTHTYREKNNIDKYYMPSLTGVRAIAAYMVCFHHFNPVPLQFQNAGGWKHLLYGAFNEMYIGVSIFFVLSGFLICYRYYESGVAINKKWFGRYMMNRVARVYPIYLLITLLTFFVVAANPKLYDLAGVGLNSRTIGEQVAAVLLNVTMLKGFFEDYLFTGVSPGWSLTVEECFYVSMPFFMIILKRSRWALLSLPVTMLLVMLGLVLTIGQLDFHGLFGNIEFMLNFTFMGRCVEFFVGIALALFLLRRQKQNAETTGTQRGWFTLIGIISVIGCLIAMVTIAGAFNVHFAKFSFAGIAFNNVVLPFAVVVLFYGLITETTWVSRLLSTGLLQLLGKSSYAFYLIHVGVINIFIKHYIVHNSIIQFLLLNVIAVLIYKYVESPLHKWIKPKTASNVTSTQGEAKLVAS